MEDRKRERMLNREIQDSLLESVMVERERGRKNRMKFLLKQSDVFRHFLPSDFDHLTSPVKRTPSKNTTKSPSRRLQNDEEEVEEEEEETSQVLRYVPRRFFAFSNDTRDTHSHTSSTTTLHRYTRTHTFSDFKYNHLPSLTVQ